MLPSRCFSRIGRPGALAKNQIFASTPIRSATRLSTLEISVGRSRQFGTTLKSHGRSVTQFSRLGLMSNSRATATSLLSPQTFSLAATRRFASTGPEAQRSFPAESAPSSEFASDFSFDSLDSSLNESILNIPEKVGYLGELGLDFGWGPTSMCQWALEHAHFTAGLSWGWSILAVSLLIRIVTFYPTTFVQEEAAKQSWLRLNPVYNDLQKKMQASLFNRTASASDNAMIRMQMKVIEKEHGSNRSRSFLGVIGIPFAIGMFKLCRAMAALPVPGLEHAGIFWVTDLTAPDPFYILPCVSTVMLILSLKLTNKTAVGPQASMLKALPWILGPITILCTYNMSAAVTLYFASTSVLQFFQTLFFASDTTRSLIGLSPMAKPKQQSDGAKYEAPRANSDKSLPIFGAIQDIKSSVQKSMDAVQGSSADSRQQKKEIADYEARRRKQDAEDYFARREAKERKQGKNKKR